MFLVIIAKWALDNIETVVKYDDIANYEQPEVAKWRKFDIENEIKTLNIRTIKKNNIGWFGNKYISYCDDSSKFIVLKPSSSSDWFRYDDIIDYYIFPLKNKFKHINGGIYPYGNSMLCYKNKEENKHLMDRCKNRMNIGDYNQMIGKWDKKQKRLANEKDFNLLTSDWRINFPFLLLYPLVYAKYKCNLDIDIENIKNSLRPCLAVYWG